MKTVQLKYFDFLMAAFVTVLLCANIIGASKVATFAGFNFTGGMLFFPLSYLFNDILTEVYGYARTRRVVWAGFVAMCFASLMSYIVVNLPPAEGYLNQAAVETVFSATPRIMAASLTAYFLGEFVNSYVLAKMKVMTEGRMLWLRTIGSTVVGEGVDTLLFYPLAFYGLWSNELLLQVMGANYMLKVLWEVLATPLTYKIVGFLKRVENVDVYDRNTNFSPFVMEEK